MDQKTIIQWKRKYGRVTKMTLEGQEVIFRMLTAGELSEVEDKRDRLLEIIPDLVILNGVELKLPGSRISMTKFVTENSVLNDSDDLEQRVLENRSKIEENFYLNLISKICSVYPYTPDQLLEKTPNQLIDLALMAEVSSGKPIFNIGKGPNKQPHIREANSFNQPDSEKLMKDSQNALDQHYKKYGMKTTKLKDKKKETDSAPLSDLHQQMKTQQEFFK